MAISCSAYGCTNRAITGGGRSFHRFPLRKPVLLKKWILATRRRDFLPTSSSYLCDKHFTKDCFRPCLTRRSLKPDAVPSLFNFSPHPQQFLNKKKKPKVKKNASTAIHPEPLTLNRKRNKQTTSSNFPSNGQQSVSSSTTELVGRPIIIQAIQSGNVQNSASDSSLDNQEFNFPSSKDNSNALKDVQRKCSNSSLENKQLNILPFQKVGNIGNDQQTSLTLSHENSTATNSVRGNSFNFLLNSPTTQKNSVENPTTNENVRITSSHFSSNEKQLMFIKNERSPRNKTTSSDCLLNISQLLLSSSKRTVGVQTRKSDIASNFQLIASLSANQKRQETQMIHLKRRIWVLQRKLSHRNEKILKLEKLLDMALKYSGSQMKAADLLRDSSVMPCFIES